MFRQVLMQTWAEGVSAEQNDAVIGALTALRRIPEAASVTGGVDTGYFPGNGGVVAVLEFCDAGAARRYVAHPDHQGIPGTEHPPVHGRPGRGAVRVGTGGAFVGFHHVKVPVSDVRRSRRWYVEVLGFDPA